VADEMSDNSAKKISYNKLKKIVKAYVRAKWFYICFYFFILYLFFFSILL
jgi:hypothetical protein